jgi:Tol biopolymer transport system component
MLTGKKAFPGEDVSDTLAAVLRSEIDWDSQKKIIPFPILQLLRRCLDRDSRNRLRDIGEARVSIQEYLADPTELAEVQTVPISSRRRQLLPWLLLVLVILLALGASLIQLYETPANVNTVRFHIDAPDIAFSHIESPVISPDGTQVAISGTDKHGQRQLWVRDLNSLDFRRLKDTEGALYPFWSPDSRFIGFFADDKLKKISRSGGISQSLADAPSPGGGTWNLEGIIVFSPGTGEPGSVAEGPLYKVLASGGEARPVTKLENSPKERTHLWPFFLPGGQHFLYLAVKNVGTERDLKVGSLDSADSPVLLRETSAAAYAPPGYLVYATGGSLFAQPFDLAAMQVTGEPVSIVETVRQFFWFADFSVSENGVLVYRGGSPEQRLVWRDRSGAEIGQVGEAKNSLQVDLFEDEKRIGLAQFGDIWFYETASDVLSRFTFQGAQDLVCSPDNQRAVFSSSRAGNMDLYLKSLGGGESELLLASGGNRYPEAWSPDGRYIVFISTDGKSVYALDVSDRQKEPRLILETPFETDEFSFSPDGKWLSYNSTESGRWEVYVASFPDLANKRQVSNSGGVQPVWSRDGKELFYLEISGRLMSVEIKSGSVMETGAPQELFQTEIIIHPLWNQYDVSKDGQFLLIEPTSSEPINVVLNWSEELKSPFSTGN